VEPLDLHLREVATRAYLRIGQPQGSNQSGHLFKLAEMIPVHWRDKDTDSQTMNRVWEQNFKTDIAHVSDITLGNHSYRAYSDGSLLTNSDGSRVGAGVVILKHNRQHLTISQRLSEKNTVFQAELHAMKAAAIYLMDNADHEEEVHIMVDSQAAIKAITKNRIYSRLVEHTKKALNTLGRKYRLTIHWIKAHQAWIFNEAADMVAKAGARSQDLPQP
jgi:ribonuclease HI